MMALHAVENLPPRPPPIAAPSTTRTRAKAIQNVGFGSPYMRNNDFVGIWLFVVSLKPTPSTGSRLG
jgi:hypothetical protein